MIHLSESLLMIDLPVGAREPYIIKYSNVLMYNEGSKCFLLPGTNYEIVGIGTLSEEQAAKCLPNGWHLAEVSANEFLKSLIESKGYHLSNPYVYNYEPYPYAINRPMFAPSFEQHEELQKIMYAQWQASEAKTLKNPVFIKVNL